MVAVGQIVPVQVDSIHLHQHQAEDRTACLRSGGRARVASSSRGGAADGLVAVAVGLVGIGEAADIGIVVAVAVGAGAVGVDIVVGPGAEQEVGIAGVGAAGTVEPEAEVARTVVVVVAVEDVVDSSSIQHYLRPVTTQGPRQTQVAGPSTPMQEVRTQAPNVPCLPVLLLLGSSGFAEVEPAAGVGSG